ncbi:probable glucan endo-1,3-beta-glucosidase A6 isoform X2 [Hibiscus syriacus]|uniref:probable glucan endo-1,3-beta-glucosidase A6 isoform X2 n=1 Tax=Hibiscus syriacus TaxID=106335 RepID=UPI0019219ED9|nr:probable glucan endo-1,3-beta-glucosidase A6 isoform X2 [Hibiscus syriacus]
MIAFESSLVSLYIFYTHKQPPSFPRHRLVTSMESRLCLKFLYAFVCVSATILLIAHCDARLMVHAWKHHGSSLHQKLRTTDRVASNGDPYTLDSPIFLPPLDSSSSPFPQPPHSPTLTPQSPSQPPAPPTSYGLPTPPPPSNIIRSPPLSPPEIAPPKHGFNSPSIFPSPPQLQPSPPKHVPMAPKQVPGRPVSEPPMMNPSPRPPPHKGSRSGAWCVAKPTVPDSLIQAAMDYACGSGADCKSIQPNQACFQPNTMMAHASYAFNSYWQNTKGRGGTCDFGGTAMLVTVDPSKFW